MAPKANATDGEGAAACLRLPGEEAQTIWPPVYHAKEAPVPPKPEDNAAGRGSGWKADARHGVRIYPERMTGLMEGRVIIKDQELGGEKMNSIYRQGFVSGVEALPGLKGIPSAGKGIKKEQDKKERGEVGGPLVWDRSTAPAAGPIGSIYAKSYLGGPQSARQAEEKSAGKTATEDAGEVKTSRCVEVIPAKDWQKLVRSEYQVENDAEALQRSHRSRTKAKGMSQEERETRWMKCFAQRLGGDEEAEEATTTATRATGATGATGATEFSLLPSGFQSKKSQAIKAGSQCYGRIRLHMFDEAGAEDRKGDAPYATVPEAGLGQFRSVYGKDYVAHIGKAPGRKGKKKLLNK